MGIKSVLGKVVWPFVHLFKALFPGGALSALKLAAKAGLATPTGQIVWAAVQDIQRSMPGAEGEAKRQAALAQIVIALAKAGLEWKASLVSLLLEFAVQRLKGNV